MPKLCESVGIRRTAIVSNLLPPRTVIAHRRRHDPSNSFDLNHCSTQGPDLIPGGSAGSLPNSRVCLSKPLHAGPVFSLRLSFH